MQNKTHVVSIVVTNVDAVYQQVNELLHRYGDHVKLRVGYPIREKNVSVIFLVLEMTLDEIGALSGKLGQLPSVHVKTVTLKI